MRPRTKWKSKAINCGHHWPGRRWILRTISRRVQARFLVDILGFRIGQRAALMLPKWHPKLRKHFFKRSFLDHQQLFQDCFERMDKSFILEGEYFGKHKTIWVEKYPFFVGHYRNFSRLRSIGYSIIHDKDVKSIKWRDWLSMRLLQYLFFFSNYTSNFTSQISFKDYWGIENNLLMREKKYRK